MRLAAVLSTRGGRGSPAECSAVGRALRLASACGTADVLAICHSGKSCGIIRHGAPARKNQRRILKTRRRSCSRCGASSRINLGYGATNAHSSSVTSLGYESRFLAMPFHRALGHKFITRSSGSKAGQIRENQSTPLDLNLYCVVRRPACTARESSSGPRRRASQIHDDARERVVFHLLAARGNDGQEGLWKVRRTSNDDAEPNHTQRAAQAAAQSGPRTNTRLRRCVKPPGDTSGECCPAALGIQPASPEPRSAGHRSAGCPAPDGCDRDDNVRCSHQWPAAGDARRWG